eukprot:3016903-Pyramimonas_sp.AAC.1
MATTACPLATTGQPHPARLASGQHRRRTDRRNSWMHRAIVFEMRVLLTKRRARSNENSGQCLVDVLSWDL